MYELENVQSISKESTRMSKTESASTYPEETFHKPYILVFDIFLVLHALLIN
jgi:hypothetical protein